VSEHAAAASTSEPFIADLNEVIGKNMLLFKPGFRNPQLDYHNIEAVTRNVSYSLPPPGDGPVDSIAQMSYVNDTTVPQRIVFEDTKETNWRFQLALTYGIRMKQSVNASIDLKKILSFGGGFEWEVSLSSSATMETSVKRTFKWSLPIDVPAKTRVEATAIVKTKLLSPQFTADVEITANKNNYNTGRQVYLYENVPGGEWWRNPLGGWVFMMNQSPRNFYLINENQVGCRAQGTIKGAWGHVFEIVVTQRDLNGNVVSVNSFDPSLFHDSGDLPALVEENEAKKLRQGVGLT
ncbi:MAG TPA: hypothetical protein VI756_24100, partial [Blastocatellia bacterium]